MHPEHSPRTQSKICSSGCCGWQAVVWHPLQTQAEVKAKAASLPVRPRLRIPTGRPATSPAGMLGAPLAGFASEFASFSWPIRQILAGANRGSSGKRRGSGGCRTRLPSGDAGPGRWARRGDRQLPSPCGTSASGRAGTVRCHRVSPSVSGHPWRFGRTHCSAFSPFPFFFFCSFYCCSAGARL